MWQRVKQCHRPGEISFCPYLEAKNASWKGCYAPGDEHLPASRCSSADSQVSALQKGLSVSSYRSATAPRVLLLQLLDGILVRKQSSLESKAPSGHIRGALGVILPSYLPTYPKFVFDRNRYILVEGINLEIIYELEYQTLLSRYVSPCSPVGYVLAGTSIRNNFPVCIVVALLPRTLLIPLYPGASSHDVAKRPRSQGGDV
ncbi:hypothetical protein ALC53_00628 [Atta colombica]|uniref:Uncharacterized protein n=1 Tax=Atta colombica TaxID=520822 RepID=A0A195BXL7_9HYME|nr:hypothetical protein ALC53_00628 [Atta colombica]